MPDRQAAATMARAHVAPAPSIAAPDGRPSVLLRWGAPAAGLSAAAIGVVYLVAWLVGAAARWSASGVLTVKANMALSLVMAGAALLLVEPKRTAPVRRAVGIVLAALVVLVGTLTLVEHVFRIDLGIDQLLAEEPAGASGTLRPNRIGPPGSASLMLLGLGLLTLAAKRRFACYFAVATIIIVLVPAVGFLSGVVQFYGQGVTGIAWPTVVGLLLLSIGVHLAEGPHGALGLVWRDDPGGRLLRQLLPAAVLAPLGFEILIRAGQYRGLYPDPMGEGMVLIGIILFMSGLLWWSAGSLSAKAAQGRVAEAEARWRGDLLDAVHDAILVWSPAGGIEAWNQGAQELYGYTAAEALGRNSHELLRTQAPRPLPTIELELRSIGWWEGELRHRTKDGREVVVSSKFRLVQGIDGREQVLEVNRDITKRKEMEDELRESSRRKDEFLGLLSHELRNPLAPIRNSIYVLEHAEPIGEQANRAKEVIARQVGHLTRLVDDLLEVTRVTRGKVQLRRARLDLGELARRTGEDHADVLKERGLRFAIHTPDQPVWVDCDETRLAQVIGNLLHNAAKFTPAGGRVTLAVVAGEGTAELHVVDTGSGIAPALIGRLFQPFVQAEQSLARSEGGLGLGLALVKGLVELHGGSVEARSGGEGQGAEFVVRLPSAPAPESRPAGPSSARPAHRALRVLVVDDNADAAESLAELARMYGHAAEVAYDGPTAIAKATAMVPDLVLCDVGLPGMNGYDVARALRSDPRLRATRLVAVTGYAQADDVERAAQAGFVGHISKPPDPAVLERYLTPT
jgi:PAS domain S-box-containing protein